MRVQLLVETLRRSGVELAVNGDRLRVDAPRGVLTPELRQVFQDQKAQLIAELSQTPGWPPESLEEQRRFGVPEARLYPFLNKTVETPEGSGRLLQVFAERAAVALRGRPRAVTYFLPSEVLPPGTSVNPPVGLGKAEQPSKFH